jgi:hypothetical protein
VALTSGRGALTALLSAADAIEIAAKVATMPNSSADDANNVFMGAPRFMRCSIAERHAVAVTAITKRAGLTRHSAVATGFQETAPPRWTFSRENVSASARVHEHLAAVAQAELHPHLGVA